MSYAAAAPQEQQLVTQCLFCPTQLSYPPNSVCIQCPKCQNTMNPRPTDYVSCVRCNTLLSHPPGSLAIQCPKCECIMQLSADPAPAPSPAPQAAPRPSPPTNGSGPQPSKNPPPNPAGAGAGAVAGPAGAAKPHKKRKDPAAPKRASNAYMIFCKERRAQLKRENPELPFGKVGAQLGEIWRNFSPEEKKPYEDRASMDRDRYKREMEHYATDPAHPDGPPKEKKPKVDLSKRPVPSGGPPNGAAAGMGRGLPQLDGGTTIKVESSANNWARDRAEARDRDHSAIPITITSSYSHPPQYSTPHDSLYGSVDPAGPSAASAAAPSPPEGYSQSKR